MGDGKSEVEVARAARENFEKQWKYYQSLSSYNQRAYRRENGILREAKSGKEFYNYVRNEIEKAHDKEACAGNIIRDLMKDPPYLVNAVTDIDGRRGLSILIDDWQGEPRLRGVIREAMNKQGREYTAQHQKIFDENFQKYAQGFKEEVEKQGQYKVERVYYVRRDLPWESEKFNEIRAEMRQLVAKHETKSGETKKIFSSEKKDIPIALFDRIRGDFVPQDYIHRKDKPLEKDFADWVAESIVDFGIGAIVRATGKILMKGGEIAVKGVSKELTKDAIEGGVKKASSGGGKFAEKGLISRVRAIKEARGREASKSLSEAVTRERMRVKGSSKEVRDTAQDMGDTFDLSKFERKISGEMSGRRSARTPSPSRRLSTSQPLSARDAYSEGIIDFIGKDVAQKAAQIGIDEKQLGTMIWLAESRRMMRKPTWAAEAYEWGYLPEGFFPSVSKATREAVRRDIQATYSLGEDVARKLILYGHDPYDICRMIDASAAKGLTATEIRHQFANELKLMNYYREKFHPGPRGLENAKAALTPAHSAPGDASVNIRSAIFDRLLNRYKRQLETTYDRPSVWDELPGEMTEKIMLDLHEKANRMTERLVKRLLGSTHELRFGRKISAETLGKTHAKASSRTESLSEAVTREHVPTKGPSRGVRDTAQDMGDTFDLSKFERKISGEISGKTSAKAPSPPGKLPTTQPTHSDMLQRAREAYGEAGIKILGNEVAQRAARMGIDEELLVKEISLAERKAMSKTDAKALLKWNELGRIWAPKNFYPLARGIAREGVKRDINMTYSLGEDTARRLIRYGHTPHDIAERIDRLAAKGKTMNEIRREFADDLKLMDYYRNKFLGGEMDWAKAGLNPDRAPSAGDVENALSTQIWERLTNRYKRALDAKYDRTGVWTELPDKMQRKILGDLANKADKITQRLVKRILGSTPAVIPLGALRRDRSIEEEEKRIEEAEAEKTKGKRIEAERAKPEKEWERAKFMEEAKVEEIEEAELKRALADKLWLSEREGAERKGREGSSEIEKEAKREKERLEKIRKGPPRSPQEEAARAQEQALGRAAEEVAMREALDFEGLKALQEERDAARLYYEKLESEDAKAWEEYQKEKKQYMEERGLATEEEFEESLASDEGAWDVYEDLMNDQEESGDEGWYEGGFGGEDEGGFGSEDEGGYGSEDEGEYEDKMEDEEKSKARREQSGGGGGESGEGGKESGGGGG